MFPKFFGKPDPPSASSAGKESGVDPELEQLLTNVGCYHTVLVSLKSDVESFVTSCQEMSNRMHKIAENLETGLSFDQKMHADAQRFVKSTLKIKSEYFKAFEEDLRQGILEPLNSVLHLNDNINVHTAERKKLHKKYEEAKREVEKTPTWKEERRNKLVNQMNNAWEAYLQFNSAAVRQLYEQLQARQSVMRGCFTVFNHSNQSFLRGFNEAWQGLVEDGPKLKKLTGSGNPPTPSTPRRSHSEKGQTKSLVRVNSLKYFDSVMTITRTNDEEVEDLAEQAISIVEKIAFDDCILVTVAMASAEIQASSDLDQAEAEMIEDGKEKKSISLSLSKPSIPLHKRFVSLFSTNDEIKLPQPRLSATPSRPSHGEETESLCSSTKGPRPFEFPAQKFTFGGIFNKSDSAAAALLTPRLIDTLGAGAAGNTSNGTLWPLAVTAAFVRVPDLVTCLAVCTGWRNCLRDKSVYWRTCVRNGGVPESLRGRFWFLLVQGKMPWQKQIKNSPGSERQDFEKGLYRTLVQRAFQIIQREEKGEKDSANCNKLSLQWVSDLEMDLHRTYKPKSPRVGNHNTVSSNASGGSSAGVSELSETVKARKGASKSSSDQNMDALPPPSPASRGKSDDWQAWQSHEIPQEEDTDQQVADQNNPNEESSAQTDEMDRQTTVKIAKLKRILCALAMYNQKVSYCQGMNYVARMLLEVCNGEEEPVFWIMTGICSQYAMSEVWSHGHQRLNFCFYVLQRLLQERMPQLYSHFKGEEISVAMFTSRWFVTLFSTYDTLTSSAALRLWDIFLMEKWDIVFKTALSILMYFEPQLTKLDFEGILHLMHAPLHHMTPKPNANGDHIGRDVTQTLIDEALLMNISHKLLDLEEQYHLIDF